MPIVPFAEYRPDVSDFRGAGQHTNNVLNVLPRGDGYGPFPRLASYSSSMAAACRGYFYARKNDGTVALFAGTSSKLYLMNNSTLAFADVSQLSSSYSALSASAQWQFEQFGKYVIAVQQNVPPQFYSLTTSTDFQDLGGSPPQAAYVTVVNRFLVLSGILTPNVYRIQWSDIDDITNWSTGQADYQDMPDGGIVRGVAGGETGVIFQDASIRRMTFSPGSPYVFGIERLAKEDGIYAPYSLIGSGDRVFFLSNDGFKMLAPGGYPEPIGKERVDRTFFADVDTGNTQLIIGAHDPTKTRVYWAYKSRSGTTGEFDKILCFDYALNKWSIAEVSGQYLGTMSVPGATLEGLDTAYGVNVDTISLTSLDSISANAGTLLSAFDTSNKLAFFNGSNLEAELETGEQDGDGRIIYINGIRPITDAASIGVEISYRMTPQGATSYSTSSTLNTETGVCPARVSGRYVRAKATITASSTWTYAAGVEPEFRLEGQR